MLPGQDEIVFFLQKYSGDVENIRCARKFSFTVESRRAFQVINCENTRDGLFKKFDSKLKDVFNPREVHRFQPNSTAPSGKEPVFNVLGIRSPVFPDVKMRDV